MIPFFSEVLSSPATASFIVLSLWFYVKITIDNWDAKTFQVGYNECVLKSQWFRLLFFPVIHSNFVHLILDITALWSLRLTEVLYGSLFVFKYTVVLALFECLSTLGIIHWILSFSRLRLAPQHPLHGSAMYGFTSIILGWIGYISVDGAVSNRNFVFYVFGFIPVPVPLAPIVILVVCQFIVPRSHSISQAGGLVGGYLLAFGVLKIMPNIFWTVCILVDIVLVIAYFHLKNLNDFNQNQNQNQNDESEVLNVLSFGEISEEQSQSYDILPFESDHDNIPLLPRNGTQIPLSEDESVV